jgi:hypothetical protein
MKTTTAVHLSTQTDEIRIPLFQVHEAEEVAERIYALARAALIALDTSECLDNGHVGAARDVLAMIRDESEKLACNMDRVSVDHRMEGGAA